MSHEASLAADAYLRERLPATHRRLRALIADDARALRALLRTARVPFEGDSAFVVAAAATPWQGGSYEGDEPSPADSYLALLPALFERLFGLLRSEALEQHHVSVTTATRWATQPDLRRVPLRRADVRAAIERAATFPLLPPKGLGAGPVRIAPTAVQRYDEHVHPGVVLADFTANRLRHAVLASGLDGAWRSLEQRAAATIALPVEVAARALADGPSLPTVAADGGARDAVRSSFEGERPDISRLSPRWAREQATSWVSAARHFRGEEP